jgi:hypothetical protein
MIFTPLRNEADSPDSNHRKDGNELMRSQICAGHSRL